jgi:8-oxo-dGTP diphosphatase
LHYVTLWMKGEYESGKATVAAPYEASQVRWYAWDALPRPLFLPLQRLLQGNSYPPQIDICRNCGGKSK